jgi:hypothetical protein
MHADGLTVKERAVLFALLAEAREVANPELEKLVGFRLNGKERRKLNDLKLVDSSKSGRTYIHELSDAGWRWCAVELSAGQRTGAQSMERALYGILAALRRYLDSTDLGLADIFRPESQAGQEELAQRKPAQHHAGPEQARQEDVDAEEHIVAGYRTLAREPGEFVRLSALRSELSAVSRADADLALDKMYRSQRINLIPQANQRLLTEADHHAAVRIGGEYKNLISIERP